MQTGLNRLIAGFERVNDVTCWVGRQLAWLLVVLMTAAVLLQVFYRYVLVNPIGWSEELAIYSMIWMTFLVAPIAYRSGANVAIEVVRDLFVGRWQAALQIVLNLLVLVLLIVLLRHSITYVGRGMGSLVPSLGVQAGWFYLLDAGRHRRHAAGRRRDPAEGRAPPHGSEPAVADADARGRDRGERVRVDGPPCPSGSSWPS
ncbi:MAG: TRAP transporter small permease subunit [Geminicoccaceae bacterium]